MIENYKCLRRIVIAAIAISTPLLSGCGAAQDVFNDLQGTYPVSSVEPNKATAGSWVHVKGQFYQVHTVYFGGTETTSLGTVDKSDIYCQVPPGSGTVDVTVEMDAGRSEKRSSDHFTYLQ